MSLIKKEKTSSLILLLFTAWNFMSCDNKQENLTDVSISSKDSITYSSTVNEFLNAFPLMDADLKLDHLFFEDSTRNHTHSILSKALVQELAAELGEDEESKQQIYYINDYYKIQTMKDDRKYEEYVQSLDIGMTKDAQCYALGRLHYGDSIGILLWKINYSSYEACPMYAGNHILASLYYHGKLMKTHLVAQEEAGMDAPMGYEANTYSTWQKMGKIFVHATILTSEEEKIIEKQENKRIWKITRKGLIQAKQ